MADLRLTSSKQQLLHEGQLEFQRILWSGGDKAEELTEELFVAAAAQLWAFNRLTARAIFHACDINGSARLDQDEYVMMKEAFVHPDAQTENDVLDELRLRAIFHKYVLSRPAQRTAVDASLTSEEAMHLARDLCTGRTHVSKVAESLLPKLRSEEEQDAVITVDDFVSRFLEDGSIQHTLDLHGLSAQDIVATVRDRRAGGSLGDYPPTFSRVVLDGRAEAAYMRNKVSGKQGVFSERVPSLAVNEDMELDPQLRAVGGWRGPMAVTRESEEYAIAMEVVTAAEELAKQALSGMDVLNQQWLPGSEVLDQLLGPGEQQVDKICKLAMACKRQLSFLPSLVRVAAPAKVFGDVHGQFRDLLLLFASFGFPSHCGGDIQMASYVFNGDFVDRGAYQLEVVVLLFALKTLYPAQVFLVRGNHEFRDMSEGMADLGFLYHLQHRLENRWQVVFEAIHSTFDWLPLAALVGGKVLVLHGGLGDGSWGLRDLENVKRPLESTSDPFLMNVLWSDPSDSDSMMARGVHANQERGEGAGIHQFGPDVTMAFCKREGINLVIRSHQYVRQGYKVMHGGHLITLFSARNYLAEEDTENDGAMLLLTPDLNGHLRVHPKRLSMTLQPPPPKESWWIRAQREWASCVQFLKSGQKSTKKKKGAQVSASKVAVTLR